MDEFDRKYFCEHGLDAAKLTDQEKSDPLAPSLLRLLHGVGKTLTLAELRDIVTGRRLEWTLANRAKLEQYRDLNPIERAFRFIYLDHLHIPEADLALEWEQPNRLVIRSKNWCPYLSACAHLGLDTRTICRAINEHCFQLIAALVDPDLKFYRRHEKMRPYVAYCEEVLELRSASSPR
jgi:hypothetical protein